MKRFSNPMSLALILVFVVTVAPAIDVVDRIVAVVAGQAITWSDVRAARALRLLPGAEGSTDAELVDRLVVRELMRAEVERFSVMPPDAADLDARLSAAYKLLDAADTAVALDALGLSEARLRIWLEDDSRIERYLQQRFDVPAQPTDEEVLTFFQSREREFLKDGRPQAFASVRDQVRARIVAERRAQLIDEWVNGLRRRATIVTPSGG